MASPLTGEKLTRLAGELRNEFSHVPAAEVEQAFFSVAEELLAHARFEDYVPLLAHRQARERLRSRSAAPRTVAASRENQLVGAAPG